MGTLKNAVDSVAIVFAFYVAATLLSGLGADIFLRTLFTPLGIIVCLLLAFMETTYNRF